MEARKNDKAFQGMDFDVGVPDFPSKGVMDAWIKEGCRALSMSTQQVEEKLVRSDLPDRGEFSDNVTLLFLARSLKKKGRESESMLILCGLLIHLEKTREGKSAWLLREIKAALLSL